MKIRVGCQVGICKREEIIELDDEEAAEIAAMTEEERQKRLDEETNAVLPNLVDCWASFEDE